MGWVFDHQIGPIRGGTELARRFTTGIYGGNALRGTIVGYWGEPSGDSRFSVLNLAMIWHRIRFDHAALAAAGER